MDHAADAEVERLNRTFATAGREPGGEVSGLRANIPYQFARRFEFARDDVRLGRVGWFGRLGRGCHGRSFVLHIRPWAQLEVHPTDRGPW